MESARRRRGGRAGRLLVLALVPFLLATAWMVLRDDGTARAPAPPRSGPPAGSTEGPVAPGEGVRTADQSSAEVQGTECSVRVVVRTADGGPVSGADVRLSGPTEAHSGASGTDGVAVIAVREPGLYRATAIRRASRLAGTTHAVVASGDAGIDCLIVVTPSRVLTGRLRSAGGVPIGSAALSVIPSADPIARVTGTTGLDGTFEIPTSRFAGAAEVWLAVAPGCDVRLARLAEVPRFPIELTAPGVATVSGRALADGPEAPVEGVEVVLHGAGVDARRRTDGDGRFRLSVPAGVRLPGVAARGEGWTTVDRSGSPPVLLPGGEARVDLRLRRTTPLTGVLTDGRRPLAGTPVVIRGLAPGGRSAILRTGQDGRFGPEGVTAGEIRVEVPGRSITAVDSEAPDAPTGDAGIRIEVRDGVPRFLELRVEPATVLAGRVLGPGGDPVPDCVVRAMGTAERWFARTREDGSFDVAIPRGDTVTLEVVSDDFMVREPVESAPADRAADEAVVLRVLPRPSIDVTVTLEGSEGAAGVAVLPYSMDAVDPDSTRWRYAPAAATDAAGRIRLPAPAGAETVLVRATAPGMRPAVSAPVELSGPGAVAARVTLHAAGRCRGRVVDADTGAGVAGAWIDRRAAGASGPRAVLAVSGPDGLFEFDAPGDKVSVRVGHPEYAARDAELSAMGVNRIRLEHERLSTVRVVLADGTPVPDVALVPKEASGPAGIRTDLRGRAGVPLAPGSPATFRLESRATGAGPSIVPLEITLDPATASERVVTVNLGTDLKGRVTDGAGHGLMARVIVTFEDESLAARSTGSGSDGRFLLRGCPAAACRVEAVPSNNEPGAAYRRASLVGIVPGETEIEIVLPRSGSISGRAVDGDGAPVRSALVRIRRIEGARGPAYVSALSNAEGWLEFRGVEPGVRYQVVTGLSAPDRWIFADGAPLTDGDDVEVVVKKSLAVAGRVTDNASRPVGGTVVRILDGPGGRELAHVVIGSGGAFSLRGIEPVEKPHLVATTSDGRRAELPIEEPGKRLSVVLR